MRSNKSPWLHNLKSDRIFTQLTGSNYFDVAIIGGGISGVSTAYFLLKNTDKKICIVEGDLVAHGATGHNAGYLVADFEKPYKEIVKEYGVHMARSGLQEVEYSVQVYRDICSEIGIAVPQICKSVVAFSDYAHLEEELHEEFLKYNSIKRKIYIRDDCNWSLRLPENLRKNISVVNIDEFRKLARTQHKDLELYFAILEEDIMVGNSALFSESLVKFMLEKYNDRFVVYEKSFVNSIRLLQNNQCIIDCPLGVCISDKVVLCTNGFENFDIYGPFGLQIDKEFHHNVSGLIGYMTGTFTVNKETTNEGGVFYEEDYNHKNTPIDAGPYIYYTRRTFDLGIENGELFCVGGPEIKLHDRRIYKKDHEVDEKIYDELSNFQKKFFNIQNEPHFKWHGLMGYTKTGIRMVGQDVRFLDLFYNLGCNGIGVIPAIAGGSRIARLIGGEKLEKSIFDPR